MDAAIREKWVAALRSGDYGQTSGMLHSDSQGGFCCLGVLCKVLGAEFGTGLQEGTDSDDQPTMYSYDGVPVLGDRVLSNGEDQELSESLCKELGIPDQGALIELNDGKGRENEDGYVAPKSFAEIADYIEANL